jgi:hypothetical protein
LGARAASAAGADDCSAQQQQRTVDLQRCKPTEVYDTSPLDCLCFSLPFCR